MEPDCAICSEPSSVNCQCEAKGLDIAVEQAEQKMMSSVTTEIRAWVRVHARDQVLGYFNMLRNRRVEIHTKQMQQLNHSAYYYSRQIYHSNLAQIDADLKRGVDEDWKISVQRYPEFLEYFFGLVEFTLPDEEDLNLKEPPLSDPVLSDFGAPSSSREGRKVRLRDNSEVEERRRRRQNRVEERIVPSPVRDREMDPRNLLRSGSVVYGMGPVEPHPSHRGYSYAPGYLN